MKKQITSFFIFITIVFLTNCTTAEIPLIEPVTETITYTNNIKTIIDNNCLNCHGQNNYNFIGGIPLFIYSQVKTSAKSGTLIPRINDAANPMPQGGLLLPENRAIIEKWKTDGFLEN